MRYALPLWSGRCHWDDGADRVQLPVGISPIGLAVDSLILGAITLPLYLLGFMHRSLRRRRGLCPACGYDLRSIMIDAPCPECGSQRASTS